jgi:hypothetical protein
MTKAGGRAPAKALIVELRCSDVHGPVHQDFEAQATTSTELKGANTPFSTVV